MSAVAERPITITEVPRRPATEKDACALALSYLRWASACWRGDTLAPVFATQLGAYWRPALPPMPAGRADAISPHGGVDAASTGITRTKRFSDTSRERLAATRCRSRPSRARARCTHTRPCTTQGSRAFESGSFALKSGDTRYKKQTKPGKLKMEGGRDAVDGSRVVDPDPRDGIGALFLPRSPAAWPASTLCGPSG